MRPPTRGARRHGRSFGKHADDPVEPAGLGAHSTRTPGASLRLTKCRRRESDASQSAAFCNASHAATCTPCPRRRLPGRARRTPPRTNAGQLSVAAAVSPADNKPNEENATDNAHQDNRHDDDCPGARYRLQDNTHEMVERLTVHGAEY